MDYKKSDGSWKWDAYEEAIKQGRLDDVKYLHPDLKKVTFNHSFNQPVELPRQLKEVEFGYDFKDPGIHIIELAVRSTNFMIDKLSIGKVMLKDTQKVAFPSAPLCGSYVTTSGLQAAGRAACPTTGLPQVSL